MTCHERMFTLEVHLLPLASASSGYEPLVSLKDKLPCRGNRETGRNSERPSRRRGKTLMFDLSALHVA